ncbi:MAG: hypothetical protein R3F48_03350 [Candidatus Zixiibacteriota bacterium]
MKKNKVESPEDYISQICFETTAYLPVYYYINKSKMKTTKIIEMINGIVSRSPTKNKLLERLKGNNSNYFRLPSKDGRTYEEKSEFVAQALNENLNRKLSGKKLIYCLQAIRSIEPNAISRKSKYLRKLLLEWFNKYYSNSDSNLAHNLRRTICWLDEALYGGK